MQDQLAGIMLTIYRVQCSNALSLEIKNYIVYFVREGCETYLPHRNNVSGDSANFHLTHESPNYSSKVTT